MNITSHKQTHIQKKKNHTCKTSRTTQYPPYPHPQIHVWGCSLSLPPSYGLGHQIPEDDAKKMLPNPGVHSSSTYANLSLVEKNMKTQCLSLHIVTIYPLVLKRTKKKSKQQQTITIVATVTVAFTSIFSATSNCIMQKINQASYVMIVWIKNIEEREREREREQIHHFRVSISLLW